MAPDWLKRVALLGASTAVCLLLLEVGLRIAYGAPSPFLFPQVRHLSMPYGYKLVPNQSGTFTVDKPVRTNSAGFRGPEWASPTDTTVKRVMVIGDSFTFGNNAREEDTFCSVLERMLEQRLGRHRVQVLDAAAGGWGVDNYAEFFATEGVEYAPDVVVVAFFNNDYKPPAAKIAVPALSADARRESRPWWIRWVPYRVLFWFKRGALVVFLRDRLEILIDGTNTWTARLFRNEIDLDADARVRFTYGQLLRIRDVAARGRVPVVIALVPSVETFWRPRGSLKWMDHLGTFVRGHGMEFVDLSTEFWRHENAARLFGVPWDNHFRPAGHALAAQQLYPVVLPLLCKECGTP